MSRFQGSGFRVQGSGFRVQGSGFRVQGSGFRVRSYPTRHFTANPYLPKPAHDLVLYNPATRNPQPASRSSHPQSHRPIQHDDRHDADGQHQPLLITQRAPQPTASATRNDRPARRHRRHQRQHRTSRIRHQRLHPLTPHEMRPGCCHAAGRAPQSPQQANGTRGQSQLLVSSQTGSRIGLQHGRGRQQRQQEGSQQDEKQSMVPDKLIWPRQRSVASRRRCGVGRIVVEHFGGNTGWEPATRHSLRLR